MTRKSTTQAQKVLASWTPGPEAADLIAAHCFPEGSRSAHVRVSGGRLTLKLAIAIDYADPEMVRLVSERVASVKAGLAAIGTVHGFSVSAGAVPVGEALVLPEPAAPETESGKK